LIARSNFPIPLFGFKAEAVKQDGSLLHHFLGFEDMDKGGPVTDEKSSVPANRFTLYPPLIILHLSRFIL